MIEFMIAAPASGSGKKDLQDQPVSRDFTKVLQDRSHVLGKSGQSGYVKVTPEMGVYQDQAISPVICEGDVIGAVVLLNRDEKRTLGELEQKVAQSAADFLGRQME